MRYCVRCVQPDTRPGIRFDKKGVCPGCRFAQMAEQVDWKKRRRELEKIAEFGRKHNVSGYDCIVAVSGGKDSTRQSMYVRDELGLTPLLVSCTYPPEQLTDRGAHNLANLITLGFDCISVGPNPIVWKELMKQGFLRFGNWAKSTEMALYACVPKVAIGYHIPLIFLGENPAIALGDLESGSTTGDANNMRQYHTLRGGPDVVKTRRIHEGDLFWYRYPDVDEMEWAKLRVVYLGYYVRDFTRFKNAEFAIRHGLEVRDDPPEDIGDSYGFEALDEDFVVVNQMIKHLKYGFGKVTDQVSEAVRLGMMTQEEAFELVKKYDGKCATRFVKKFCRYLGISEQKFKAVVGRYRNKDIWKKDDHDTWHLVVNISRQT